MTSQPAPPEREPDRKPEPRIMAWGRNTAAWLRTSRLGLFAIAVVVGVGSGLGAVAFRYLVIFCTWLPTGYGQFGQAGWAGSAHLPWLGLGFFVLIPSLGGLVYGPLIYRWAREARGHGVPEVMIAVAERGGRIRPQVSVVKALASALCIGTGGSVGREGPIVQIGSALASSLGQWVRLPDNRMRILVACGAGGGIAATFNAPITGVFFGVEVILREFSVDALFTVMLSAMIADAVAIPLLGSPPFLAAFPAGITLPRYGTTCWSRCWPWPQAWSGCCSRPWCTGRGPVRPVVETAARVGPARRRRPGPRSFPAGRAAALRGRLPGHGPGRGRRLRAVVPARAGGREDPGLQRDAGHRRVRRGVRAVAVRRGHLRHGLRRPGLPSVRASAGPPALYAVVAMGAVFASAVRAPLTSVASVVEMTGDFTLTLPVMLAVAVATLPRAR